VRREQREQGTTEEEHVGAPGGDLEHRAVELEAGGDEVERRRLLELGLAVILDRHGAPEEGNSVRCKSTRNEQRRVCCVMMGR